VKGDQDQCRDDAKRRRLGGCGDTDVDRSDDHDEEQNRGQQIGQAADAVLPVGLDFLATPMGFKHTHDGDGQHKQARQHETRCEPRKVDLDDRALSQHPVNDHIDGRRDQDADGASRSDGTEEEPLVVSAFVNLLDGDRSNGRRRCDAGARDSGEHGARADVGVHEPARQPRKPMGGGGVHLFRNSRAEQDLAQQDEQGDGDENDVNV